MNGREAITIYGTNSATNIHKLSADDLDLFWQLVDMDICEYAITIVNVVIDTDLKYVMRKSAQIITALKKSSDPAKTYLKVITTLAKARAKRPQVLKQFNENQAANEEDLNFWPKDMQQDSYVESGDFVVQVNTNIDEPTFENPNIEVVEEMERQVEKIVTNYTYLTNTEKSALLCKIGKSQAYPLPMFNDAGIRHIGYRALIKKRLQSKALIDTS